MAKQHVFENQIRGLAKQMKMLGGDLDAVADQMKSRGIESIEHPNWATAMLHLEKICMIPSGAMAAIAKQQLSQLDAAPKKPTKKPTKKRSASE